MFANCAIAGGPAWRTPPSTGRSRGGGGCSWPRPCCCWPLPSQVRQNGIIASLFAAVLSAGSQRPAAGVAAGLGVGGSSPCWSWRQIQLTLSLPAHAPKESATKTGLRIVQNYDLVGALAMDPRYRLDIMAAADRPNTTTIQAHAKAELLRAARRLHGS